MISDKLTKKSLEGYGGILSILTGFGCVALAVMDEQAGQSMWRVWVIMSLVLVVNGIAMIHNSRRNDSPLLPGAIKHALSEQKVAKART